MTSSELLQQSGISETSLSPSVKEGINQILKAATYEGVTQFGKILAEEANKRGIKIGGGTSTTDTEEAAVLAAKEEYEAQQAAAKRKRIILVSLGAAALLVAIVVSLVFINKRKPKP